MAINSTYFYNLIFPFELLVERQNIVEIFVNDAGLRENLLENYLKKMPDFQKLEVKFLKQKANLQVS
jgi:DNA mismatch repair ATPase MutS